MHESYNQQGAGHNRTPSDKPRRRLPFNNSQNPSSPATQQPRHPELKRRSPRASDSECAAGTSAGLCQRPEFIRLEPCRGGVNRDELLLSSSSPDVWHSSTPRGGHLPVAEGGVFHPASLGSCWALPFGNILNYSDHRCRRGKCEEKGSRSAG